jgi:superfamily I DNA and RNA helicase
MPLEVVYGSPSNPTATAELADTIAEHVDDGTLYLGYPILATADEKVEIDALLVTEEHGLTAYQIPTIDPGATIDWQGLADAQDRLYNVLESHLSQHPALRQGRKFLIEIETVTILPPTQIEAPEIGEAIFKGMDDVGDYLDALPSLDPTLYRALKAALERVSTIRPAKKRANVVRDDSRGATMQIIERGIANLDFWQKQAAIETPAGPQRIRGLAGSGKTIVLALKAALLHARDPELDIAVTFSSRALYQQFEDLITRFSFAHMNDRYDPEQLRIMHAWGGRGREGMYYRMAESLGVVPRDFASAASKFGRDNPFEGVCDELLQIALERPSVTPIFDVVLIDEAQDLPPSFFRLVHLLTRDPKRVVWAYDELQKLDDDAMASLGQLFGTTDSGDPVVNIDNRAGEARRDIVLRVCYRNTPWALATAHAIGFGIYRNKGLIQHFDEPKLWEEIGYQVDSGTLTHGSTVELERSQASTPTYFLDRLDPQDAVLLRGDFQSEEAQDTWVAEQILNDLNEGELEPDDIMVVLPSAFTAKSRFARLAGVLRRSAIDCHLVGVGSSADEFFVKDSVAIGHIYRAKGNEAPMVYVLDTQFAGRAFSELSARNIIFTAITRSKAWVRICGWGPSMPAIGAEIEAVRRHNFHLTFKIPTLKKLAELRRIDAGSVSDVARLKNLDALVQALQNKEITKDQLPPEVVDLLDKLSQLQIDDDNP